MASNKDTVKHLRFPTPAIESITELGCIPFQVFNGLAKNQEMDFCLSNRPVISGAIWLKSILSE
jgi:hypothetical protein